VPRDQPTTPQELAGAVAASASWNARVALVRKVPERFGTAQQADVYAAIADRFYVRTLKPDFSYVHWRQEYEFVPLNAAYEHARTGTAGFTRVERDDIARVLLEHPETLRIFRLLLGFTASEFAETCMLVVERFLIPAVSRSTIGSMEGGRSVIPDVARTCAIAIDLVMNRDAELFPPPPEGSALRLKIEKPDTAEGWTTIRRYAAQGVPLSVLLHQRGYGGAFRQLLDATSSDRGDLVEDAVAKLFSEERIPYIQTGAHNQEAVAGWCPA
jgi:transcriptional regulator with XRE-family HTH domain